MQQDQDRETRIGAALLLGLAAFTLLGLVSVYFQEPAQELSDGIRSSIVATR